MGSRGHFILWCNDMRKLACAALSFSAAVFAANYILLRPWLPLLAAVLAISGISLVLFKRRWLLGFEIALISAAFGLSVFCVHSSFTAVPAGKLSGTEQEISAVVLDYPIVYDDYCKADIRLTGENTPKLKAVLYDDNRELENAAPGQHIRLTASLRAADTRYGEDYDYYFSKGIYLIANSKSSLEYGSADAAVFSFPVRIKHGLTELINTLFPADVGPFMSSLMLGDKSGLYDNAEVYSDLSRAGLMHLAAVSGMHMSFLALFIGLIFGRGRFGSFVSIPLLWLFALVSGASPSAVRAAFMLSLLLMAPVLRRENDPLTSLSAALALVLLGNPYAATSVSLHLSFAAISGVLCLSGPIYRSIQTLLKFDYIPPFIDRIMAVVSTSIAVIPFTMPILALHFGYVSVLSPISNVLAMWAIPVVFCGGFICCALGAVLPGVGSAAAWLLSWAARYIFLVAKLVSDIDFAVVYLDNPFMWLWFFLGLAAILAVLFMKAKGTVKLIYPLVLCSILLVQANVLSRWYYSSGSGTMAVLDVGQGQSLAFIGNDGAAMVDCGATGTNRNAGEKAGAYLKSRGVNYLDALVLTHMHSDHVNGVLTLLELVEVENIYMPSDPQDDEGYLPLIEESAKRHGSSIHFVAADTSLDYGNLALTLFEPSMKGQANERCVMCKVSLDDYSVLITADGDISAENELVGKHEFSDVDAFIVGHHGSRYSTGQALLESLCADTAIISTGYNNYGHPTHEVLERLAAYGYDIYRTDLNGTVEIRPQRQD